MPNYDFEGQKCKRSFEKFIWLRDYTETLPCEACKRAGCIARVNLYPRRRRLQNQQCSAVIYYKHKSGKIMVATDSADPTPKGWQRCEANTLGELRKIEKHLTQEQLDIRSQFLEREQAQSEAHIAENRAELRAMMKHFSGAGQAYAREMMRRNDTRRSIYDKKVDPAVHFNITEYDGGKRRA